MKGLIKIEFILGVVVFAVIIFYIAAQINAAFLTMNTDTRLDILKSKAISLMEIILKDSELVITPNNLRKDKILEWETNNCNKLNGYSLGGYRLTITEYVGDTKTDILTCGYIGLTALRTDLVRAVSIDSNYGLVRIEMW